MTHGSKNGNLNEQLWLWFFICDAQDFQQTLGPYWWNCPRECTSALHTRCAPEPCSSGSWPSCKH